MNNPRILLSSPHMGGLEKQFIQEAFETNWIAPLGPNVNAFEKDLEIYLGDNNYVAALSSGTAAIHLGLLLLGVQKGDTVICQSMTFSASANPIIYLGATPIFIDSEPITWNICPISLERAILDSIRKGKKPKAIIAVDLYGMPYLIDSVRNIASEYQIPVLEDSAEALGSEFKGQKCGTFGDIGILSFNGNKIITTSGGGALIANSVNYKEKAIFLATQARDPAPHYQHSQIGYNYRMSNICAGIGRGQLKVLSERVNARRQMHDFYVKLFREIDGVDVFSAPNEDYSPNYWITAILIHPNKTKGITSEYLRSALELENIESRPLWKPMHLQPVFKNYPFYGDLIAENLFNIGLCLPSGSNLTNNERLRIRKVIKKVFNMG